VINSTRDAPARCSALAQAWAVLPVVSTSSIRSTVRPATAPTRLSCAPRQRTSALVPELFDMKLRSMRRDRAQRLGAELFLLERAFDDCLDRLSTMVRRFDRALLIGCPDPEWRARLGEFAAQVDVADPGPLFAKAGGGLHLLEDTWQPEPQTYDLVVAIGTLDTVNDLPRALITVRWSLKDDGLFLGSISGGDTVPRLRSAMRAADAVSGAATPHIHPRIEASAMAPLLANAGFLNPVVDVDRVRVSYLASPSRRGSKAHGSDQHPCATLAQTAYQDLVRGCRC
jgi:NADH dehydrogenase [ubiquinone] 1 alpha subcomplex assembly factor 5